MAGDLHESLPGSGEDRMPIPRQMRYAEGGAQATVSFVHLSCMFLRACHCGHFSFSSFCAFDIHLVFDWQGEDIATLVEHLRTGTEEACWAAKELYALTSFSSAVTIDHPSAYTAYDKLVFGGASVPDNVDVPEAGAPTKPPSWK